LELVSEERKDRQSVIDPLDHAISFAKAVHRSISSSPNVFIHYLRRLLFMQMSYSVLHVFVNSSMSLPAVERGSLCRRPIVEPALSNPNSKAGPTSAR
jgi:hypothetical protein